MAGNGVSDRVVDRVREAAILANKQHGAITSDLVRACAILGREWGEAMNEALMATLPAEKFAGQGYSAHVVAARLRMYDELAQVAATAMLIMEQLEGVR